MPLSTGGELAGGGGGGGNTGALYVNDFGGDPTGVADSTVAFNNAVATLPTVTSVQNGTTYTVSVGTVSFGPGRYKMNSAGVMATVTGPWTTVTAPSFGSTTLVDYNSSFVQLSCTTNGTTTLTTSGNFLTAGIVAGMTVFGTGIATNTLVKDITATTLTMSQAATNSTLVLCVFTLPGFAASNPHAFPGSGLSGGSGLLFNGGGWNNLIFEGINAAPGLNCFELYGGGECWQFDCAIQNYPAAGTNSGGAIATVSTGVVVNDYAYNPVTDSFAACWCEGWQIRLRWSINVGVAVSFRGEATGEHVSNSQGRLSIDKLVGNPGQSGLQVANGAWIYHSSIYMQGVLRKGSLGNGANTTVAAGSNGVNVATLNGTSPLFVANGTPFSPDTVAWVATNDDTYALISFSSSTSTTLVDANLLFGTGTLSTGANVYTPVSTGGKVIQCTGTTSTIENSELVIGVECDQLLHDPGTSTPFTLSIDDNNSSAIINCWGSLDFTAGGAPTMTPAAATSGTWSANAMTFSGPANGDIHIAYHSPVGGPNFLMLDY